jgi:hypothetical protein
MHSVCIQRRHQKASRGASRRHQNASTRCIRKGHQNASTRRTRTRLQDASERGIRTLCVEKIVAETEVAIAVRSSWMRASHPRAIIESVIGVQIRPSSAIDVATCSRAFVVSRCAERIHTRSIAVRCPELRERPWPRTPKAHRLALDRVSDLTGDTGLRERLEARAEHSCRNISDASGVSPGFGIAHT